MTAPARKQHDIPGSQLYGLVLLFTLWNTLTGHDEMKAGKGVCWDIHTPTWTKVRAKIDGALQAEHIQNAGQGIIHLICNSV